MLDGPTNAISLKLIISIASSNLRYSQPFFGEEMPWENLKISLNILAISPIVPG